MPYKSKDVERERKRKYREENREQYNASGRTRRNKNIEVYRKKERERKRRYREKRREEINSAQRESYKRNREQRKEIIAEGKVRRDPSRGLIKLQRDFEQGRIGFSEYIGQIRKRLEYANLLETKDPEIRKPSESQVMLAIDCSKGISELIKTKVEMLKLMKRR